MRDDGTIARLDGGGDCAIVATKGLGVRATADPASPVVGTLAGRARVVAYANDAKATARALLAGVDDAGRAVEGWASPFLLRAGRRADACKMLGGIEIVFSGDLGESCSRRGAVEKLRVRDAPIDAAAVVGSFAPGEALRLWAQASPGRGGADDESSDSDSGSSDDDEAPARHWYYVSGTSGDGPAAPPPPGPVGWVEDTKHGLYAALKGAPRWARDASQQAQFVIHARDVLGAATLRSGKVLDVAGGNGVVACLASTLAGADADLIDPQAEPSEAARYAERRLGRSFRTRREKFVFDDGANDGCACVLGYRPCEATEPIVAFALRTRTPFMLLPCCAHRVGDEQPDSCGRMLDLLRDRDPATIKKGKLPGSDTDVLYATFRDDAE